MTIEDDNGKPIRVRTGMIEWLLKHILPLVIAASGSLTTVWSWKTSLENKVDATAAAVNGLSASVAETKAKVSETRESVAGLSGTVNQLSSRVESIDRQRRP